MDNQHKIIVHDYKGHGIAQREKDGYVYLTHMAQVHKKKVYDWTRQEGVKAYIQEVSTVTGIPVTQLIEKRHGGNLHR